MGCGGKDEGRLGERHDGAQALYQLWMSIHIADFLGTVLVIHFKSLCETKQASQSFNCGPPFEFLFLI